MTTNSITLNINPEIFNDIYQEHVLDNQHRVQIVYGGSSSGKSYSTVGQRTVIDMMKGGRNYLVTRNVANTIAGSVWNEVIFAINEMGLSRYFRVSFQKKEIVCEVNGYMIFFRGLDDAEKIKSIRPLKGVITDILMEEATENSYESFKQLLKRQRGLVKGDIKKRITLLFNPILKTHWIYQKFFKGFWTGEHQYQEKDGLSILKTTYRDNRRFLTKEDVFDLENEDDPYYHSVYTEGEWGVLGEVIFKNWRIEDFNEEHFDNYQNGLDWGFAKDPFAVTRSHYDSNRKIIYICDEIYEIGLQNEPAARKTIAMVGDEYIICDSAEPKSIADFIDYHVNAQAAVKGKGSVESGVKWLQGCTIVVHPRCQNTINELQQYQFKKDKYGNVLPVPVDKFNHIIDALRYAYEEISKGDLNSDLYEDQNNEYPDDEDDYDDDEDW